MKSKRISLIGRGRLTFSFCLLMFGAATSHGLLQGDLDSVGPDSDPATPVDYIYDALTASATPARTYLIDPGAS